MPSVLIDTRSGNNSRSSGWERYVREIEKRIVGKFGEIQVFPTNFSSEDSRRRVISDLVMLPLTSRKFDLIHFPTFPPIPKVYRNKLTIYHLHDLTWWKYSDKSSFLGKNYYKLLAQKYVEGSGLITTGTETVKQEIESFFEIASDRVRVITPGVNLCKCPNRSMHKGRPYLLFVGTIEPRKNLELLINAFEKSNISRWLDLTLAGRFGWGRPLPNGVHAIGAVTEEELHSLYSNCFAVVQPSLYEGFGLTLIEAAIHSKPVICSNLRVFHEVLGDSALYVDPFNEQEWIGIFNELSNIKLEIPNKDAIINKFNWDNSVGKLIDLYKEMLD